ncbi:MAG: exonuclease domain-containing protein [Cytophagaceae bacterium]|jgi:DNA polymerase-3 subunit epsilon|nr:exonuclease domain-containing protein [Cytophagaceae bacterium]
MYAIIDIETTGGSAKWHKITEICILLHDGNSVVDRYSTLVNPERSIPPSITLLTGITNEMVATAPVFAEVADTIQELTKDAVFVAHNVNFDYGFVKQEFEALGIRFQRKKMCTVRLSRKLLPGHRSYSLGNLCQSLGIVVQDRHRAFGDATATTVLFERLLRLDEGKAMLQHALNPRSKEATLPPHVSRELLDAIPEETGVYFFYDQKGKVMYVGKAQNLRHRVAEHFSGNTHTKERQRFHESICDVRYELAGSEFIALLMENEAIKKYYPRYNKSNKTFQLNVGLYTYEDQNGYLRLSIAQAGKRDKPVLTFANQTEAITHALLRVNKYSLCLRLCSLLAKGQYCGQGKEEVHTHFCPVCHGGETPEVYNQRFSEAFLGSRSERSYVIKTKGRTLDEDGFAYVEKGKFLGYGFLSKDQTILSIEELKGFLIACYDTTDSQSIVQSQLKKSRLVQRGDIEIYQA